MKKKSCFAKVTNKVSAFAVMLVVMLSGAVMLTSCSDDEDEDDGGAGMPSSIVGVWEGSGSPSTTYRITFESNGTGHFTMSRRSAYGHCEFTYKTKGNTVTTTGPYVISYDSGEVQTNENFKVVWTNHGSYLTSGLNSTVTRYNRK